MDRKCKVLVGLSGGVDSAVAALLLKNEGLEVIGATLILNKNGTATDSVNDAQKVCKHLDIEHRTFDFTAEFSQTVIKDFIDGYKSG
ncbi:MAG: 7-cyano-7-deazaguanine synthase, partial [Oscillospiraceae bacterium]|nr:7-cyano-7-deazaguanine synthase [Candidatus Equicaccousia limihippi]